MIRTPVNWIWWLFHNARVFRSRAFCVIMIVRAGALLHRSTVFPPFFRFPFMERDDVQIGDTWTDEAARGRGLAGVAIRAALETARSETGRAWYVVEERNGASIRAVEKEGFDLVGRGDRVPRIGLRLLGYYVITEAASEHGAVRT